MATTLDVDPYLPNAYSKTTEDGRAGCRFDLTSYQDHLNSTADGSGKKKEPAEIVADELLLKKDDRKGWEPDVRGLVSTRKWLSLYGLKANKLNLEALMKTIGFKKRDGFDYTLLKPIPSKYVVGKGFVDKYTPMDGKTTNVAVGKDRMVQLATQLKQAISLFRRRMEWMTTESRRIFGVIQESVAIIILDVKTMSPQQFDQYRCAVERVLKEQVSSLSKFNLYRPTDDPKYFKPECTPVSQKVIDEAIDWLWTLDRTAPVGSTSACEAVMKALDDQQASGIYLFTMGNSCASSMELMLSSCKRVSKPLNIVAYNCTDSDHMKNMRQLTQLTKGRFHAYGVIMEMESFDAIPAEEGSTKANIALRKRTIGGVPAGAGVRPDVIELFEELEEAQNNLAQLEKLISQMPESQLGSYSRKELKENQISRHTDKAEEYMGSADWISTNGLKIKRLSFFDLLGKVAFKHCDGVVKVRHAPGPDEMKTDSNSQDMLVNARYCDQFAHVKWRDGSIVHVQVTPETHRVYEEKVSGILNKISSRINWLQKGSRQLFGTIIERRLYIIIDTSGSMAPSIQFVKDKLFLLLQEQIRHKDAFNIISFGGKVIPWRDRLVEVNEENLKSAWNWVKDLDTEGSTNTLGALKYALADPCTEGIYLLSDGRPDHPPKSVLAQVTLQKTVPIHTISFNCADSDANKFLCQLAKDTKGRYHYFSEHGEDVEGPEPYQSEDIRLLKEELELGDHYLQKVTALRDECQELQWRKSDRNNDTTGNSSRFIYGTGITRPKSGALSLRSSLSVIENTPRPHSARAQLPTSHSAPVLHTNHIDPPSFARSNSTYLRPRRNTRPPSVAAHTKTSILRTLSANNSSDWVLPESRVVLNGQFKPGHRTSSAPQTGKASPLPFKTKSTSKSGKKAGKSKKKQKFQSSKNWLLKNGLRAKQLLLLDALSEAIRKDRSSEQVDSQIVTRLLDQELSPEHKDTKDSLLSNPYLEECLEAYEEKIIDSLKLYRGRLDRIVWESISEDERNKFRSDDEDTGETGDAQPDSNRSSTPISFEKNKATLMDSLDRCGWPVTQNDIMLLEEEIELAEMYLKQSEGIRLASEKYEKRDKDKPLSDPLPVKPPKSKSQMLDQLRGQKVTARCADDGFYYDGLVLRSKGAHHVMVQFENGDEVKVSKQFVIPTKGAIAVPTLMSGDYVLTMVKGANDQPCYVPGQVEITPKQATAQDGGKFYEVTLYNGNRVSALRSSMVKIGKARYNFAVAYIRERAENGDDDEASGKEDNQSEASDEADNDNGEQVDDATQQDDGTKEQVVNVIGKYHKDLERLCYSIINKQREQNSRQKRLHKQMRVLHKEYKNLKKNTSKQDPETADSNETRSLKFHSLDGINDGEEVLARWLDEGWYYRCQVSHRVSERTYMLKDSCGHLQQTSRDDIIADNDDLHAKVDIGAHVIARHPNYYYSYTPAVVDEVFDDYSCSVTFYDDTRSIVEREDVYLIDEDTYERDVHYILKCEEEMIGQAVVARDNSNGIYRLGTIKRRAGNRQYKVEFADGRVVTQSCVHIFGVFSKQYTLNVGDRCLAISNDKDLTFLPGTITAKTARGIDIKFIDGSRKADLHILKTFWIAEPYYDAANTYYRNRNYSHQ